MKFLRRLFLVYSDQYLDWKLGAGDNSHATKPSCLFGTASVSSARNLVIQVPDVAAERHARQLKEGSLGHGIF